MEPTATPTFKELLPGTWKISDLAWTPLECPLGLRACAGGYNAGQDSCIDGYMGPMCGKCVKGMFLDELSRTCNKCTSWGNGLSLLLTLPLALLLPLVICCCFGNRRMSFPLASLFTEHNESKAGLSSNSRTPARSNEILEGFVKNHEAIAGLKIPSDMLLQIIKHQGDLEAREPSHVIRASLRADELRDARILEFIARLKIIISLMQITANLPMGLKLPFPSFAAAVARGFSLLSLASVSSVPIDCLEPFNSYFTIFEFASGVPLLIVLAAATHYTAKKALFPAQFRLSSYSGRARLSRFALLLLYICYVSFGGISAMVFAADQCVDIDPDRIFAEEQIVMLADLFVRCNSGMYQEGVRWILAGFALYTLGIPSIFLVLLTYNRKEIRSRVETEIGLQELGAAESCKELRLTVPTYGQLEKLQLQPKGNIKFKDNITGKPRVRHNAYRQADAIVFTNGKQNSIGWPKSASLFSTPPRGLNNDAGKSSLGDRVVTPIPPPLSSNPTRISQPSPPPPTSLTPPNQRAAHRGVLSLSPPGACWLSPRRPVSLLSTSAGSVGESLYDVDIESFYSPDRDSDRDRVMERDLLRCLSDDSGELQSCEEEDDGIHNSISGGDGDDDIDYMRLGRGVGRDTEPDEAPDAAEEGGGGGASANRTLPVGEVPHAEAMAINGIEANRLAQLKKTKNDQRKRSSHDHEDEGERGGEGGDCQDEADSGDWDGDESYSLHYHDGYGIDPSGYSWAAYGSRFLFEEYCANAWYWECIVECPKRVFFMALLSQIAPGSSVQIIVAIGVALFFLKLHGWKRPFRLPANNAIADTGMLQLVLTLLGLVLQKEEDIIDDHHPRVAVILDVAFVIIFMMTPAVFVYYTVLEACGWSPTLTRNQPCYDIRQGPQRKKLAAEMRRRRRQCGSNGSATSSNTSSDSHACRPQKRGTASSKIDMADSHANQLADCDDAEEDDEDDDANDDDEKSSNLVLDASEGDSVNDCLDVENTSEGCTRGNKKRSSSNRRSHRRVTPATTASGVFAPSTPAAIQASASASARSSCLSASFSLKSLFPSICDDAATPDELYQDPRSAMLRGHQPRQLGRQYIDQGDRYGFEAAGQAGHGYNEHDNGLSMVKGAGNHLQRQSTVRFSLPRGGRARQHTQGNSDEFKSDEEEEEEKWGYEVPEADATRDLRSLAPIPAKNRSEDEEDGEKWGYEVPALGDGQEKQGTQGTPGTQGTQAGLGMVSPGSSCLPHKPADALHPSKRPSHLVYSRSASSKGFAPQGAQGAQGGLVEDPTPPHPTPHLQPTHELIVNQVQADHASALEAAVMDTSRRRPGVPPHHPSQPLVVPLVSLVLPPAPPSLPVHPRTSPLQPRHTNAHSHGVAIGARDTIALANADATNEENVDATRNTYSPVPPQQAAIKIPPPPPPPPPPRPQPVPPTHGSLDAASEKPSAEIAQLISSADTSSLTKSESSTTPVQIHTGSATPETPTLADQVMKAGKPAKQPPPPPPPYPRSSPLVPRTATAAAAATQQAAQDIAPLEACATMLPTASLAVAVDGLTTPPDDTSSPPLPRTSPLKPVAQVAQAGSAPSNSGSSNSSSNSSSSSSSHAAANTTVASSSSSSSSSSWVPAASLGSVGVALPPPPPRRRPSSRRAVPTPPAGGGVGSAGDAAGDAAAAGAASDAAASLTLSSSISLAVLGSVKTDVDNDREEFPSGGPTGGPSSPFGAPVMHAVTRPPIQTTKPVGLPPPRPPPPPRRLSRRADPDTIGAAAATTAAAVQSAASTGAAPGTISGPTSQNNPRSLHSSQRHSLIAAIQHGAHLRSSAERRPSQLPKNGASPGPPAPTGIASMLEKAMKDRRMFVESKSDDGFSDVSGFSDSDTDSPLAPTAATGTATTAAAVAGAKKPAPPLVVPLGPHSKQHLDVDISTLECRFNETFSAPQSSSPKAAAAAAAETLSPVQSESTQPSPTTGQRSPVPLWRSLSGRGLSRSLSASKLPIPKRRPSFNFLSHRFQLGFGRSGGDNPELQGEGVLGPGDV